MRDVLFIALAGALGTLSRYGLSGATQRATGISFPYGTLAVNVLGSLAIGFIMQMGLNTDIIPRSLRVVLTVGFLGGFTTLSTFSYETVGFLETGAWGAATLNISATVGLSIMATLAGIALARTILGGA